MIRNQKVATLFVGIFYKVTKCTGKLDIMGKRTNSRCRRCELLWFYGPFITLTGNGHPIVDNLIRMDQIITNVPRKIQNHTIHLSIMKQPSEVVWSQFHLIWTPLNKILLFNKAKGEDNDTIIQHFISCIFRLFFATRSGFSNGLANLLYIEEINAKKREVIKIMFQEIHTISSYI